MHNRNQQCLFKLKLLANDRDITTEKTTQQLTVTAHQQIREQRHSNTPPETYISTNISLLQEKQRGHEKVVFSMNTLILLIRISTNR